MAYVTTQLSGYFIPHATGAKEGTSVQHPTQAQQPDSGVFVGATATQKAWGGLPVSVEISAKPGEAQVRLATTYATAQAWLTFDGANHLIQDGESIGLYEDGESALFYRGKSNVEMWVKIDDTLAAALLTGTDYRNTAVSWDFTNNMIIAFDTTALSDVEIIEISMTNNEVIDFDSGTNTAQWSRSQTANALAKIRLI